MIELLAPAGNTKKMETAYHFGADAVYIGGADYSLRAYANNFDINSLGEAVRYAHKLDKKIYAAVNIFPKNSDFGKIDEYLQELRNTNIDGVIVSDLGVIKLATSMGINTHISTQANTTNAYACMVYKDLGASRIVLAREVSINEIAEIRDKVDIELEAFVHGAMCISYSGRCLLSNYLADRDSNRGECVQACRWQYKIREVGRNGEELELLEDSKGSYILNSRDLNMIEHIKAMRDAGVCSFKIEGRMKSQYYVGNVINAYRRAIDNNCIATSDLIDELYKNNHRGYTTGFYLGEYDRQDRKTSQSIGSYDFMAEVLESDGEYITVEQRNRFIVGDELEVLSSGVNHNKVINVCNMYDTCGNIVSDAKLVQQMLKIPCKLILEPSDILRKKIEE